MIALQVAYEWFIYGVITLLICFFLAEAVADHFWKKEVRQMEREREEREKTTRLAA